MKAFNYTLIKAFIKIINQFNSTRYCSEPEHFVNVNQYHRRICNIKSRIDDYFEIMNFTTVTHIKRYGITFDNVITCLFYSANPQTGK